MSDRIVKLTGNEMASVRLALAARMANRVWDVRDKGITTLAFALLNDEDDVTALAKVIEAGRRRQR